MINSGYINPYKRFVGAIVPNGLLERREVSPGAKLAYARLCQHAAKDGELVGVAWPKRDVLARELGVKARQVDRYLDELQSTRLIEIRRRGFKKSNLYRFKRHSWMDESTDTSTPESTDMSSQESTQVSTPESTGTATPIVKESKEKNQRKVSRLPSRKPDSDPRIHPLITSFSEKYQKKSGRPYPPAWGKDSKSLKRLLAAGETRESITEAMELYFADPWHTERGFDIGRFCSSFSSLVSKSNGNARGKFQSVPAAEGKYAKYS